jgi:hypothetical protein
MCQAIFRRVSSDHPAVIFSANLARPTRHTWVVPQLHQAACTRSEHVLTWTAAVNQCHVRPMEIDPTLNVAAECNGQMVQRLTLALLHAPDGQK